MTEGHFQQDGIDGMLAHFDREIEEHTRIRDAAPRMLAALEQAEIELAHDHEAWPDDEETAAVLKAVSDAIDQA